jgi:iron complex outermembrane recepter protein
LPAANPGNDTKKPFDIPAGDAVASLKRFSAQAGTPVIFPEDAIEGTRTRAVKGDLTPADAIRRLVAGTSLKVARDQESGAFAVSVDRTPARERSDPNVRRAAQATTSGRPNPAPATTPAATAGNTSEQAIELSPFVVSADDDSWLATSTLAGSRLNTPLRDTGASIAVLTSEFLKDLAAVDLEDVVGYAVNVHLDTNEGTNVNDNWAMGNYDASRVRIRGVAATVTRNYFRWGLQSDSYNADRIEENRGPNSILFGIGSAGGVVNTLTKRANLSRNFRRASVMVGSYGSYRGTVDLNQSALNGKLAVRVNAVYSEMGNYRHHAFNDTQRLHLASTWQVRENTQLRVDYEIGEIQSVGLRPAPAYDGVGSWIAAGSQTFATVQTGSLPARGITQYSTSARRLTFVENLGSVFNYQGQNRATGNSDVILDRNLVDFSANPVGPYNRRDANFQALSVFWEQKFGRHTFAELSHNLQFANRETFQAGQGRVENATLYADPHQFLPNGQPNPYAGAMMFEGGRWNTGINRQKSHNTRLMLSHEMDFGQWGNYRLAAMGEHEWRKEINRIWVEVWEGRPFNSQPENDQNHVWRRYYVTPGDWASYHAGTGPLGTGLLRNVPDPTTPGRTLNSTWVPFNQNQRDPVDHQDTILFGGHARYLSGRAVLGFGFRKDKLNLRTAPPVRDPTTNQWTLDHPTVVREHESYEGTTRTLGAVGHVTRHVSLFYNFSNSINVPDSSHRILPDGRTPPNSQARGQDFGVRFTVFDGRLSARINRYTVDMVGATGGGFSGTLDNPTVLNNRVLTALQNAGAITPQQADAREFTTNQATIDRKLEGYEFNLTGALTKNWRLSLNYSYSDGYDSNIGPEVKVWAAETIPWYLQYGNVLTSVAGSNGQLMTVSQLVAQWEDDVRRLRWLREGDLILGNRKHKYSVLTRYSFDRGPLKGLFGGVGYRFQSKAPTGFDNNEKLLYSKSQGEADGFLGYRIRGKRAFLKNGVSLQLNVRNLLNEKDPRITTLRGDGVRVSRALIVPPRSWRLTANFEF